MAVADTGAQSGSPDAEGWRQVAGRADLEQALQAVVDLAISTSTAPRASVTLVKDRYSLETAARSDDLVNQADQLQYDLDEGPCLAAAEDGGVWLIPDTATDERFPRWSPAVAELGLRSVLSIHLFTQRQVLGALNLYFDEPQQFTAEHIEVAKVVAAHASVAMARLRGQMDLWQAIDSRHLVGQAQGILIERFGLNSEKAFEVLRRYSQQHNTKLRDVAAALIETGALPDERADRHANGHAGPPARGDGRAVVRTPEPASDGDPSVAG